MYKDREGNVIRPGDAVATAVTINHEIYAPFSFVVTICKKKKGRLILEGVYTQCMLKDRPAKQLQKLHAGVDLDLLNGEWIVKFKPK